MEEGRKRVLLIAASILAARKLAQYDGGKRVPATISAISDAIRWAEEIMVEIDRRWPVKAKFCDNFHHVRSLPIITAQTASRRALPRSAR